MQPLLSPDMYRNMIKTEKEWRYLAILSTSTVNDMEHDLFRTVKKVESTFQV